MIRNNTIGAGRLYFLANEGRAAPTEDISVIGNTFVGKAMTIRVDPPSGTRSGYRVIGNVSDTPVGFNGGGALAFSEVVGIEVRDNVQPMQKGRHISGLSLRDSRNVVVSGNRFPYGRAPVYSPGRQLQRVPVGEPRREPAQGREGRRLPRPLLIRTCGRRTG